MNVAKVRIALVLALTAFVMSIAGRIRAEQGPPAPSPQAVADSRAVAATHRSRTLAALLQVALHGFFGMSYLLAGLIALGLAAIGILAGFFVRPASARVT